MATKRWLGQAAATYDLWTITVSGTMTSQTYSVTINGKSVTYVANGSATATVILAGLAAAIQASVIPEFLELTAAASPAGGPYTSLTLTGTTLGRPSTVSVATGGAATFAASHTTTATGPNDFTNPQNWSTGTAPANSDVLVFDNGSSDCKYNLGSALTGVTVNVSPAYSGNIGLPFINNDGQNSYNEYRATSLTLAGGTVTINAPNVRRLNLAFGANTAVVTVSDSGNRLDQYTPAILIIGGDGSSTLDIIKGDVGVAFYQGQTATFATISTSYKSSQSSDVKLFCGAGATLTTINKSGGDLTVNSAVTTLTQGIGGGTMQIVAGAITTLNIDNGTCVYDSTGTLGTAIVSGRGILDFGKSPAAKTVTNPIELYGDFSSVNDPQKTVNSGTLEVTTNETTTINVNHGSGSVMSFA